MYGVLTEFCTEYNPQQQPVEIYKPDQNKEIQTFPATLSGEDVLPKFVLDLSSIT